MIGCCSPADGRGRCCCLQRRVGRCCQQGQLEAGHAGRHETLTAVAGGLLPAGALAWSLAARHQTKSRIVTAAFASWQNQVCKAAQDAQWPFLCCSLQVLPQMGACCLTRKYTRVHAQADPGCSLCVSRLLDVTLCCGAGHAQTFQGGCCGQPERDRGPGCGHCGVSAPGVSVRDWPGALALSIPFNSLPWCSPKAMTHRSWSLLHCCTSNHHQRLSRCAGPHGQSCLLHTRGMPWRCWPMSTCCARCLYQRLARRARPLPDAVSGHAGTACNLC